MADEEKPASSWIYPDREAWEKLLRIRPRPRPVMEKPDWWRGRWPPARPGKPAPRMLAGDRILDKVRNELDWAQKCFYYAESILPESAAREKSRLIAGALGRARKTIDSHDKAKEIESAAHELAGVARYDPAKYPKAFVEAAGSSLTAMGKVMETSRFQSVAYWGRVFVRAGGYYRAMRHDLPGG